MCAGWLSRGPGRLVLLVLCMVLVVGMAGDGAGIRSKPGSDGRVAAHDKPKQRWGSAAGQEHIAGKSGNRTVPKTLRAQYPLRPVQPLPKPPPNKARVAQPPTPQGKGFDQTESREVAAWRGPHQRAFLNPDGTATTEFSPGPVNYWDNARKAWTPIDARLQDAGSAGWRNRADAVGVNLAPTANAPNLATLSLDANHRIAFGLAGAAQVRGQAAGTAVTYRDARPRGTDLRLESAPGGVKETLVLRSPDAPHTYVFPMSLAGLSVRLETGQLVFTDETGRRRATIPAGFMYDSANDKATSAGVTYRLITVNGGPALQVDLDSAWLRDPARRYPVMVDPSVSSDGADSSLVVHGSNSYSGSSELLVGRKDGAGAASYIKFGGLVDRLRYHTVFGAQLQTVNFDAPSCSARRATVHPVTQSWSPSSSYNYPGPDVGGALTGASFAQGYIAIGQSKSACPARGNLFNLGAAGRKLVQGWVDGAPNNGLSLRASASDSLSWKRFAGSGTANSPRLYVTHSPYNAKYTIPNPVPEPPVLQNQAGKVKVTVTHLGAETWTPSTYYLAYRAYDAKTGKAVTQQRAANLPGNLTRGAKVTLDATIKAMPIGTYFLDFTMVRAGGKVFTDEQVPPGRIVLQVFNIPPVVQELYPPNGYQAQTLTPQLWARAVDIDAPPGSSLQYKFEVCDQDAAGNPVNCTTTPYQASPAWTVPAGRMVWSKAYQWRAFVKDATSEVPSPRGTLLTHVPQPAVTSKVAGAPYGSQEREFDPQVGNFSTGAVDASATTAGPDLTLLRTYNSLDPRRNSPFGAGWTTRYDMRLISDDDGSGNIVVSYPDGQEVRFGKNPDGSYAAPQGRSAALTFDSATTSYKLQDKAGTSYHFAGSGRLTKISDAAGRSVVLTYNSQDGKLAKAQVSNSQSNTAGRALTFTWSGAHITGVSTDPVNGTALTWTYTYTGDLLTKVCAPGAICTTYAYAPGSHYRTAVLDDRPDSYWRLGESQAGAAASEVAINLGKDRGMYKNVTLEAPGAIAGSGNAAATFNGMTSAVDLPNGTLKKSRDAAIELWFKANTAGPGGPLIGYQDKALGTASTRGLPLLYHGTDGLLRGQFWNGTIAPMTSSKRVNDGLWHHVVLSSMGATQTLYLDGAKVGTAANPVGTDVSTLTYNQVGAAYTPAPASWTGWGSAPERHYNGTIDDVAVYTHPLSPGAVTAHFQYGASAADQLTKVTMPSGKMAAEVDYDTGTGRVAEYTDRNGGTWKVGAPTVYGGDADLRRGVEVRDPAGRPYLYEYDALAGRMIRSGSPTGLVMRDEDRPDATPSAPSSPPPTTICTSPDPGDQQFCTTIPGSAGGPVFEGHDLDGMAIRSFGYDGRGFQNEVKNENGDAVTLGFDDRGNVTSRKTCRTGTECYTEYTTYPAPSPNPFDPRNELPTERRDGRSSGPADNRFRTTFTYHPTGQLATQTNPDGSTVQHTYTNGGEAAAGGGFTPPGLVLNTKDARGAQTAFGYFQNGDLASVKEPSGLTTTFTYDAIGRKASETETSDAYPGGVTTTYTYDALSRPATTTEPATTDAVTGVRHQSRTTTTYDADGNVAATEVTDLLGGDPPRRTSFEYDDNNRLDRVTDPEGGETTFGYDRFGNKTSMVDVLGNKFEYGYTARNMLAEVRLRDWDDDPGGAGDPGPGDSLVLHSYAYDFAGRMVRHTDAMGHRVEYEYYRDDLPKSTTLKNFRNPDGTTRDYVMELKTYDGAGHLVREVAGNGELVTEHTINPVGTTAATVTDPGGLNRRTAFTYDNNGNVTKTVTSGSASNVPWTTSSTGETVEFGYDPAGNLVREAETAGDTSLVTSHTYDQRNLRTSTTDPRGNVAGADKAAYTTTFGYDEMGRQITTTGPPVRVESNGGAAQTVRPVETAGYNTYGEPVATKDPLGNVSRTSYDRLGRTTAETDPTYTPPGGGAAITPVARSTYDAAGNATETIDPAGNVTRYGYDKLGRLVKRDEPAATNDDRAVWKYTYTRTGDVLSVTDPTGARVETTYDDLDRQVTMTQVERRPQAGNFTTRYTYDDSGDIAKITQPSGAVSANTYDRLGQLTEAKDAAGVVTRHGYDFAGRQVRMTDGLGRTSRTDYDAFGQVAAESDLKPDTTALRTQRYTYDPAGNMIAAKDPLERTTTYDYDAINRLIRQVEPVSGTRSITTTFGYDAVGNRTKYTDGRGNPTVYTVNSLGLPESVVEPATPAHPAAADRTWTARYDESGDPVRLTAPGGVTRDRTYDAAGRLTKESGAGAQAPTTERTRSYDPAGRVTKINTPGGTNTYEYNDRGGLLKATGPSGDSEFGYDPDGQLTRRTDASGTTQYSYVQGRLATITDGITGGRQTLGYDGAGLPKTIDYGAGRVRTFGYDDLGRLSSDELKNNAGQTVASIGYGYDLDDRLTRKTTTGLAGSGDNTYGYDNAGRLTSWKSGSATTNYEWDDSGNRTRNGAKTATYDARNRLQSDGDYTYAYSPRGTLQTKTSSGLSEAFSFDAFDRLIGEGSHSYRYDGLDRVASRDGADFAYAGLEDDPVSDGTATYARDPAGELLAVAEGGGGKRLSLTDDHGDVVGGFDPTDTTLSGLSESTAYSPFGEVIAETGSGKSGNLGYQGDWTDPATSQVNMGARWYNPGSGTFISRDSIDDTDGDSILANRYTYAAGDPLDNTDPDGHFPCGWCKKKLKQAAGWVNHHVVQPVYHHVVRPVINWGASAARWVYHKARSAARWVYNKARSAVRWVANKVASGYRWLASRAAAAARWAAQRAEQVRRAAIARAHAITRKARAAVAWVAKHNPLPAIKAALKPLYTGIRTIVSAAAHLPARVLSTVRNVVADVAKTVRIVYQKAVEAAGTVIESVSTAVQAVSEFVQEHAATIAGIAAGVVVGVGCGALIGWTGVGAVACGALAGAVGSLVQDLVEGGHSWKEMLLHAAVGGTIGAVTGGLGSVAGAGLRAGAGAALSSGLRGAGGAALGGARAEVGSMLSGRLAGGRLAGAVSGGCSFLPGTGVLMADGSRKPIEQVKPGDKVIATDPITGRKAARPVTDIIVGADTKKLVELTVDTDGSRGTGTGVVIATDNHPFWVAGLRQWRDAGRLQPGMWLRTSAGTYVQITAIRTWSRHQEVYNLTVDRTHTFHVAAGSQAVLVHNCPWGGGALRKEHRLGMANGWVTARSKALWHRTMGTQPKPNATIRDLLKLTAGNRQYDDKAGLASGRSPEELMASIFRPKSLQYMTVNPHKRSIMFEGNHRRFELLDRARDPADEDITWDTPIYIHRFKG